jgi:uncharacterized protein YggT (Ycf19 family)
MDRESKSSMLRIGKVLTGIVYAIFIGYIVILTLAFFLRLFGANPAADFAEWVYNAAARIMEPFRGIFPTTQISDTAVFDASLLFAIIVYAILALAVQSLIAWFVARLTALQREADRERYYAQVEAAQAGATVPGAPVPGTAPPGPAGSPPPPR